MTIMIEINPNDVVIFGQKIVRSESISPSQWMDFWDMVNDNINYAPPDKWEGVF